MTSNPYTPDEAELIGCYAGAMEEQAGEDYATAKEDAERGIAKIKANSWDELARLIESTCRSTSPTYTQTRTG